MLCGHPFFEIFSLLVWPFPRFFENPSSSSTIFCVCSSSPFLPHSSASVSVGLGRRKKDAANANRNFHLKNSKGFFLSSFSSFSSREISLDLRVLFPTVNAKKKRVKK